VASAIVVYRSHSGVTRRYGEAIAAFLTARGLNAMVVSAGECDIEALAGADYLFLGCWTSGLFVVAQHPDEPWLAFVRDMPAISATTATTAAPGARPKTALFTTYKLRTGSMFPRMKTALAGKTAAPALELKSRDGTLSRADETALERFLV
jgi:flavodoxin